MEVMEGNFAVKKVAVAIAGGREFLANAVIPLEKANLKIGMGPFDKDSAIESGGACTDDSNFHLY